MAAGNLTKLVYKPANTKKTLNQKLTANGDFTDWIQCSGDIAIQLTGAATAVTAVVERSTTNPTDGSNPAPAGDENFNGNPATGITVKMFYEPGIAWWRVRLTALTGSDLNVSLSTSGE